MLDGKTILQLPEVKAFIAHFGVTIDPLTEPERFIRALRRRDPRKGRLRQVLEDDKTEWSSQATELTMDAGKALGLLRLDTCLKGKFELVIALGGARQSNLDRLRYAVKCLQTRKTSWDRLVIAGSTRRLGKTEKANTANYAPRAKTEVGLCKAAASVIMDENPSIRVDVVIVKGGKKAGNPQVIEVAIESTPTPESVAVITTQIYQATAALDLARVARMHGIKVTAAAGNPSDPAIVAKRTLATYLSEVIRTLRAAVDEARS